MVGNPKKGIAVKLIKGISTCHREPQDVVVSGKEDYPKSWPEFEARFSTEEA